MFVVVLFHRLQVLNRKVVLGQTFIQNSYNFELKVIKKLKSNKKYSSNGTITLLKCINIHTFKSNLTFTLFVSYLYI